MRLAREAVLSVLAVSVAACGQAMTASPEPSIQAREIAIGALAAGRYTNTAFTPRIHVKVPSGWLTYHLGSDFFDVAVETDDGPVVIMFVRPMQILTPTQELTVSDPAAAIRLLEEHPGVTVSEPREVEIGGVPGLEAVATFERDNTHVMRVTQGDLGFGPQNDLRLTYMETDAGLLVIGLNAPDGTLAAAERLTRAVWASISIDP